ncbi:HNH endonuclease [Bacillus haynesii]|uniref:HNH endonuclease n=1 Tax=Bacillus haynesii TaxID=1925021 RepID=UPI0035DDDBCA
MRNLVSIHENYLDRYISIANSKRNTNKNTLLSLEDKISKSYQRYLELLGNLEEIEKREFADQEIAALLHSYNNSTKPLNEITEKISTIQPKEFGATCQYCGIGEPNTNDHYIPKESFPEFCVFPLNLVPCCPVCNTKKGSKWLVEMERQFVNLYFDYIPRNIRFLHANIEYNGEEASISFFIERPLNFNAKLYRIINNHYYNLCLFTRYIKKSNEYISEIETSIIHSSFIDREEIKKELIAESLKFRKLFGANYYKVVICEALINCDAFINSFVK